MVIQSTIGGSVYNLFTILPENTIARVSLNRESQKSLSDIFQDQAKEILNDDRERHEYAPSFVPTDGGIIELEFNLPAELAQLAPTIPNNIPKLTHEQIRTFTAKAVMAVNPAAGRFAFQAIDRRRFLGPRRPILLFGPEANELKTTNGLVLGEKLDALYEGGYLYFTSETVVRRFLDLDSIFREATDTEIVDLLNSDKFMGFDENVVLDPSVADTWVRRKVMFIKQSNLLDEVGVVVLRQAAKECGVTLGGNARKIAVPDTKKELKVLLKFLSEDFLESPIRRKTIFEVSGKRRRKI